MMKFKFILSAAVLAGTAVTGFADGYQDGVEYYQVGQGENAKIVLDQTIKRPGDKQSRSLLLSWQHRP